MPSITNMLDYGNFVYSPELPEDRRFAEYLGYADRLLKRREEVEAAAKRSPFSPEVEQARQEVAEVLREYVASFNDKYGKRAVEHDSRFLPVSDFFAKYRPIQNPFSILHCTLDLPLHTVHAFNSHAELMEANAALAEDTPLSWWQRSPHNTPCYLFGERVWELKPSETAASKEGIALVFLNALQTDRQKLGRLSGGGSATAVLPDTDSIPERLRVAVWRQSGGKCAQCGGHRQLEFDFVKPLGQGGAVAESNIQMLCDKCYRQKHNGG